ncbi:MAG: 50S ribosomal protein L21 [Leptospirales bacterium]|nr:50S ribosomal protein L21 [Leptospirales bacterium]
MYAYIRLGGHQHRVEKDMILLAELSGQEAGKEFTCSDVLVVGEGESVKVGKPTVAGAQVQLKVLEIIRSPKVSGMKFKRRKGFTRRLGHRQQLQKLQVVAIKG